MDLDSRCNPLYGAELVLRLPPCGPLTAPPLRVLAFGDSLTVAPIRKYSNPKITPPAPFEPYALALAEDLGTIARARRVETLAVGLCGNTTREMAEQLNEEEITDKFGRRGNGLRVLLRGHQRFDIALIMAGSNDLPREERCAADIVKDLQEIHMACHDMHVPTLALAVPPLTGLVATSQLLQKRSLVNASLEAWALGAELVTFVHTDSFVPLDGLEADGVHFERKASRALGHGVAQKLRAILSGKCEVTDVDVGWDDDYEAVD